MREITEHVSCDIVFYNTFLELFIIDGGVGFKYIQNLEAPRYPGFSLTISSGAKRGNGSGNHCLKLFLKIDPALTRGN
jgi:hypothetical protein